MFCFLKICQGYIEGNQLKVGVEMFSANLLSEIILPGLQQTMHFYDRDKQTWHMQLATVERGETEYLKVKMSYDDVKQIPRDHARYVSWKFHVRPVNINATSKTEVLGPFCKYYQQRDVDFSYEIATNTPLTPVGKRFLRILCFIIYIELTVCLSGRSPFNIRS